MTSELPPQGSVISYPYLWARERGEGENAGRKSRPVCLILQLYDAASAYHHLILLPITSQQPAKDRAAIEIPDTERRRAGLTRYSRAWVILDEYNYDIAERSWYFEPQKTLGRFGSTFVRAIAQALRSTLSNASARVDRTA